MGSGEYVEITNLGDEPQNLAGWLLVDFSDGYLSFTFPSHNLASGESIRVYTTNITLSGEASVSSMEGLFGIIPIPI